MATLTVTLPDNVVTRVRAAYGYPGPAATVPEVEAKVRKQIENFTKSTELQIERDQIAAAHQAEAQAAIDAANNEGTWPPV